MRFDPTARRPRARRTSTTTALLLSALLAPIGAASAQTDSAAAAAAAVAAHAPYANDPRVNLGAGWMDAKEAASNLTLVAHRDRPAGFFNPEKMCDFGFANADLAFSGNYAFQGGYNGVQIWNLAAKGGPALAATLVCPGGQGDVSVWGKLMFMSVEETRGRIDCGTQGVHDTVSAERFRGVRIFDISDMAHPKQVAAVQTCRGSHTHTLVTDPADRANIYVYVSGTSVVRSGNELAGCSALPPEQDPNTSYFRIDVIKVPLARPRDAKVVSSPRVFADSAGNVAGLWKGGNHGEGTQKTSVTNQCHDITVYPELHLAAGACSGNGILLDIHDVAKPKRVAEVSDPNFAYWHSATFSNDGAKVLFTDEWGGGTQARCQATDRPQWGADAIYTRTGTTLTQAGFYKLPAPQTATENCVAHNGSLIPVPGRDIMVQAWYQGGVSVFDFTDPAHPKEIAYFDRGPMSATELTLGGYWSAYWYNGRIVGSEIGRGLDVFELAPSEFLSKNEIAAAKLVRMDRFNPQLQTRVTWPANVVVARAYLDQLQRDGGVASDRVAAIGRDLDRAEKLTGTARRTALTKLASRVDGDAASATDVTKVKALAASLRTLAAAR